MIASTTVTGLVFLAIGLLIMLGAALNWSIVSRPGKLLNRMLGDTIARVIYFGAGIFLFLVGVGRLIGSSWF